MKKLVSLIGVLVLMVSLSGCSIFESETELAVIPMDSFVASVTERGIEGRTSSLKRADAYRWAVASGDIGNITIILEGGGDESAIYYSSPLWADEGKQNMTVDQVVIAGALEERYNALIECYKCGYSTTLEENVCGYTIIKWACNCSGKSLMEGIKKVVMVSIVPIP